MKTPARRSNLRRGSAPSVLRRAALVAVLALAAPACVAGRASSTKAVLRLGIFPNITHATAIAGVEKGFLAGALGQTRLETQYLNAGPEVMLALLSGALDATYVGPSPAINAYAQSKGAALRIVAGATSGGAFLIVKPGIRDAAGLRGKKVATPQRGNTQDIALRSWLASKDMTTTLTGGGDVTVVPQENAQTLETFKTGTIDGAWVPEPWASRLVLEGGGSVLVDERDLWPGGRYVTTHLVVRTDYLQAHRDEVAALLRGHVQANDFVNEDPAEARRVVATAIAKLTGKSLPEAVIGRAWSNLTFTLDPFASSLRRSASDAVKLGLLKAFDLNGIYDLSLLNTILSTSGKPEIR